MKFHKLSQFHMTIHDTDLCVDSDHINEFAVIINNDLTTLDKMSLSDAAQQLVLLLEQACKVRLMWSWGRRQSTLYIIGNEMSFWKCIKMKSAK